jgi:nicotinamide-nucleotide adenylyltransferase
LDKKIVRALFVGRFQPIHLGHMEALRIIFEAVDELIIVIGSSQKSHELDDPFTAGERISMIRAALDEMEIPTSRYYLIPVPDSTMHSSWVSMVIAYCPPFHIVYSNEPLTRRLFREAGRTVQGIPLFQRKLYSATEIRQRILTGKAWKALLPQGVVAVIEDINGVERLKELAETDSPFTKKLHP